MVHKETQIHMNPDDKVLTQQHKANECNINTIVERARRGEMIEQLSKRKPVYGDFRNLPDLRQAMNIVRQAENGFANLDANVRKRFGNDPVKMLDFLNDPANREEAIALGLVKAPEPKAPDAGSVEAPLAGAKKAKAEPVDE